MTAPTPSAIHAVVPWAVLESVRTIDSPSPDDLPEYHEELATKRLGMSRTVATQIERFQRLARRDSRVDAGEVVALLRLVGRRKDAGLVFTDAGRRAGTFAAGRVSPTARGFWRVLPGPLRRRFGRVLSRRALGTVLDLGLSRASDGLVVSGAGLPSGEATPDGSACKFYGAAVSTVLATYTGFDGAILHESCAARGDPRCEWHVSFT